MTYRDLLALAAGNVRRGGTSSLLCVLAVCVAICSVCTIGGLGSAAQNAVVSEVEQTGLGGLALYADIDGYTFGDAELRAVSDNVPEIAAAMPLSLQYGYASLRGQSYAAGICGVDEQLPNIFHLQLLHGRMLQKNDISSAANVVLIDRTLAEILYQRENITGKQLTIGIGNSYDQFEIIGILDSQTEGLNYLSGGRMPHILYVPYSALDHMIGAETTDKLAISCSAGTDEASAVQRAIRQLQISTPDIEFKYENLGGYTKAFKNIVKIITIFISAVAAVSIVVGGIGVMNSMVSSAEKRTREIGVYMALGATRHDILHCFLWEAILICLLGGLLGGSISLTVFVVLGHFFHLKINLLVNILACIIGAGMCGVIFGIIPAKKACQLNPIDAIRDD